MSRSIGLADEAPAPPAAAAAGRKPQHGCAEADGAELEPGLLASAALLLYCGTWGRACYYSYYQVACCRSLAPNTSTARSPPKSARARPSRCSTSPFGNTPGALYCDFRRENFNFVKIIKFFFNRCTQHSTPRLSRHPMCPPRYSRLDAAAAGASLWRQASEGERLGVIQGRRRPDNDIVSMTTIILIIKLCSRPKTAGKREQLECHCLIGLAMLACTWHAEALRMLRGHVATVTL